VTPALLLLALTVHVPAEARGLTEAELVRLQPEAQVSYYSGPSVDRLPSEPLVIFVDRCPREVREGYARLNHPAPLAAALLSTSTVFVFVRDLEDYLGMPSSDPRFRLALGRVIAHEVEHVRRGSPDHDKRGFFQSCLSRTEMLALAWGK
jgi:hypothetical protein